MRVTYADGHPLGEPIAAASRSAVNAEETPVPNTPIDLAVLEMRFAEREERIMAEMRALASSINAVPQEFIRRLIMGYRGTEHHYPSNEELNVFLSLWEKRSCISTVSSCHFVKTTQVALNFFVQ